MAGHCIRPRIAPTSTALDAAALQIRQSVRHASEGNDLGRRAPHHRQAPHPAEVPRRWLPVISSWNKRVLFIDGFSGPGEYAGGEEGSPIIALRSLLEHTYVDRMSSTEFVFIFIDQDRDRIEYLEQVAIPRLGELPSNVRVECGVGSFDAEMGGILDGLEDAGHNLAPAFAFVDPFGFSDTPMELIGRILAHPRSEVLVTVMLEPVNRFLNHPSEKIAAHYDGLFGDLGWRDLMHAENRIEALGDFYADQLFKHAEFVWSFRMLDEGNRPIYERSRCSTSSSTRRLSARRWPRPSRVRRSPTLTSSAGCWSRPTTTTATSRSGRFSRLRTTARSSA